MKSQKSISRSAVKKYFILLLVFSFQFIFSQKISIRQFKKIDDNNIGTLLNYLSSEIPKNYKEDDVTVYNDNIFRISMVGGHYDQAIQELNKVRSIYLKTNPIIANAMGAQFEVYMNALKRTDPKSKNFMDIYNEELEKKYNSLPSKSQGILSSYFAFDADKLKTEIDKLLVSEFNNKENVDVATAIALCRKYNSYITAKNTFQYAKVFLKEIDQRNYSIQDSVMVKTKNGKDITLTVVLNKRISQPAPTIVINTIYSSPSNLGSAKDLANNGYMCVYISTRGKYLSNEKIEPFEHEAEDIYEVIDWISKQPWSNGKVGMIGGSYLGFSQWAATKKLHPALKTIVPQVAVGIGIDYPMTNNVFMSYMLRWIDYVTTDKFMNSDSFDNSNKWKEIYKKWYLSGESFSQLDSIAERKSDIFQRWLQHPSFDNYWSGMIPDQKDFANINIPILTTTGYFDADQIGALYYYKNHLSYNKNANHYVVIGPYNHAGGQGSIQSEIEGLKIDEAANINLNKICTEWFDYILKDKPKPEFLKDKFNYQVIGDNTWKSAGSLNDLEKNKVKFYISKDSKLSENKGKSSEFSKLKVDFSNRKDVNKQIAGNILENILFVPDNYLQYSTETFDKEVEFTGNISGELNIAVNKKDCDLSMYLYEKLTSGKYFLLSSYLGRASYAKDNRNRNLLTPNEKTIIPIKNSTYVSKKIEKGSKLILLVGINKNPQWQLNYGTGKDVSTETIADAKEPMEIKFFESSYLELPIFKN